MCKVCGRSDKFDFNVPDSIWAAVVPPKLRNKVICLACFDEFARSTRVDYSGTIQTLYFAGDRATFAFKLAWSRVVD